jgi:peptidoglycan hydrolase FlgJ
MLDHQWAVHVAESGGVGLKDVLMRQLTRHVDDADAATGGAASPVPELRQRTVPEAEPAERSGGFKQALFEGAESFVRTLEPLVRRIAGASGIDPVAVLAQAALETGWGSKVPHDNDGRSSYNLFGIKANGWEGPSVDVTTLEHQFGRFVRKVESFRAYQGIAEAVEDYVALLSGNQRYAQAMDVAQDPRAFADALQEAGYATDPAYAEKQKTLQRQIAAMLGRSQEV